MRRSRWDGYRAVRKSPPWGFWKFNYTSKRFCWLVNIPLPSPWNMLYLEQLWTVGDTSGWFQLIWEASQRGYSFSLNNMSCPTLFKVLLCFYAIHVCWIQCRKIRAVKLSMGVTGHTHWSAHVPGDRIIACSVWGIKLARAVEGQGLRHVVHRGLSLLSDASRGWKELSVFKAEDHGEKWWIFAPSIGMGWWTCVGTWRKSCALSHICFSNGCTVSPSLWSLQ